MYFQIANLDETTNELQNIVITNCNKAAMIRKQIERLKLESSNYETIIEEEIEDNIIDDNYEEISNEDNDFEDEINFYLEDISSLEKDFAYEDLIDILPSKMNYNFKKIIFRLQAESIKEIKEINEFIREDSSLSKEELEELKECLELENKKISFYKQIIIEKDDNDTIKHHNKIILTPTYSGNIRILEELTRIPSEYYPGFKEIINSIIDGTFKGVKRFTNNNLLTGFCEVRGFKVRIVFSRIGKDTYALITAFVKKTTNDKAYQEYLKSRITEYKSIQDDIKELITNEDFISTNENNLNELFNILSIEDIKSGVRK
jgi:hypothetical protein